jgi:hypothetical protein
LAPGHPRRIATPPAESWGIASDVFRFKPALERWAVCRLLVAEKKPAILNW